MPDSDDEYVADLSDDDMADHRVTSSNQASEYGTRSKSRPGGPSSLSAAPAGSRSAASGGSGARGNNGRRERGGGGRSKAAWEDIQRSWEEVVETADGSIELQGRLLEAEKRRRLLRDDTTPLQRGIIRHLVLVLDMSFAMAEKDMLPSRYLLTLALAVAFVREFFEQNPISQLAVVGMRDGVAVRVSDMGGNPAEHIERLRAWHDEHEPMGNPSLQNALEMCRGALFHAPAHGTREVLIIYGALLSSDPGDIRDTIDSLVADRIRVSVVGLAAQVAICAELCARTNGGDDPGSYYAVAMHEQHFRELFLAATTPPPITASGGRQEEEEGNKNAASLLMMGFPDRVSAGGGSNTNKSGGSGAQQGLLSLCACHHRPTRDGHLCPRCQTKVCRLPAECPACGLTLILSTHLARSYHHLFPLRNWVEVPWAEAEAARSVACYACLAAFPPVAKVRSGKDKDKEKEKDKEKDKGAATSKKETAVVVVETVEVLPKGVSESGRYACQVCRNHFCIDCDVFAHEVIHNCPGCQSDTRGQDDDGDADAMNGAGGGEPMVID